MLQKEHYKQSILILRVISGKIRFQAVVTLLLVNSRTKENFLKENFHPVNTATRQDMHLSSAGKGLMQNAANVIKWDMRQSSAGQQFRDKMLMHKWPVKMMKIKCS
jgi:hypothetical protein